METYVTVMFWLSVIGLCLRGLLLSISRYPRTTTTSLGADLVSFLVNAGFMAWAGMLLFAS